MMMPTEVSSRLNANPMVPPGNCTISPDITPERPYTRAMPSPTSSTRPTSRTSICDWKCSISCWTTEAISSALNLMDAPVDHLRPHLFQLHGDGRVIDGVADPQHHAADQALIGVAFE